MSAYIWKLKEGKFCNLILAIFLVKYRQVQEWRKAHPTKPETPKDPPALEEPNQRRGIYSDGW